jgi:cytochrome P450
MVRLVKKPMHMSSFNSLVRSILHDPAVYPEPEKFKPERFLTKTPQGWKINPAIPDPDIAFGFGRR